MTIQIQQSKENQHYISDLIKRLPEKRIMQLVSEVWPTDTLEYNTPENLDNLPDEVWNFIENENTNRFNNGDKYLFWMQGFKYIIVLTGNDLFGEMLNNEANETTDFIHDVILLHNYGEIDLRSIFEENGIDYDEELLFNEE